MVDYDFPVRSTAVGARIREERELLGFQGKSGEKEFAKKLGVNYQVVRNMETSEKLPKAEYLGYMAQLKMDFNYVLTGQRPTSPDEAALLQNYRDASQKNKDHMKAVGVAFAKSSIKGTNLPVDK